METEDWDHRVLQTIRWTDWCEDKPSRSILIQQAGVWQGYGTIGSAWTGCPLDRDWVMGTFNVGTFITILAGYTRREFAISHTRGGHDGPGCEDVEVLVS